MLRAIPQAPGVPLGRTLPCVLLMLFILPRDVAGPGWLLEGCSGGNLLQVGGRRQRQAPARASQAGEAPKEQ